MERRGRACICNEPASHPRRPPAPRRVLHVAQQLQAARVRRKGAATQWVAPLSLPFPSGTLARP
eukprot:scaffold3302_cov335-Prasinococcus_capsulatus_cf.AAC.5